MFHASWSTLLPRSPIVESVYLLLGAERCMPIDQWTKQPLGNAAAQLPQLWRVTLYGWSYWEHYIQALCPLKYAYWTTCSTSKNRQDWCEDDAYSFSYAHECILWSLLNLHIAHLVRNGAVLCIETRVHNENVGVPSESLPLKRDLPQDDSSKDVWLCRWYPEDCKKGNQRGRARR